MHLATARLMGEGGEPAARANSTTSPSDYDANAVLVAAVWLMFYLAAFATSIVY